MGVARWIDSRCRGSRVCVAGEGGVTDRTIDRDGVPAHDIAVQPGLLIRALQEEVARRPEYEVSNIVESPRLFGRLVLKVGEDDQRALGSESIWEDRR